MKSFSMRINGKSVRAEVVSRTDASLRACINGVDYEVEISPEILPLRAAAFNTTAASLARSTTPIFQYTQTPPKNAPFSRADGGQGIITAPMAGSITQLAVATGTAIEVGTVLLVIEAMKMENRILAERGGVVDKLFVKVGEEVLAGTPLLKIV